MGRVNFFCLKHFLETYLKLEHSRLYVPMALYLLLRLGSIRLWINHQEVGARLLYTTASRRKRDPPVSFAFCFSLSLSLSIRQQLAMSKVLRLAS